MSLEPVGLTGLNTRPAAWEESGYFCEAVVVRAVNGRAARL